MPVAVTLRAYSAESIETRKRQGSVIFPICGQLVSCETWLDPSSVPLSLVLDPDGHLCHMPAVQSYIHCTGRFYSSQVILTRAQG